MRAGVAGAFEQLMAALDRIAVAFFVGGSVAASAQGLLRPTNDVDIVVVGVLRVQAGRLDLAYLREWAPKLGVSDLFEEALGEASGTT